MWSVALGSPALSSRKFLSVCLSVCLARDLSLSSMLTVGLCFALLRPHHLRVSSAPPLVTRRSTFARTRVIAAVDDASPPTAPSADVFAGMQEPISLDSPEGAEALQRMQLTEDEQGLSADDAPASPPTAPAADVFAGMQAPIALDSPKGADALARMQREDPMLELAAPPAAPAQADSFLELASVAPPAAAPQPPAAAPRPALEIQEDPLYPMPALGEPSVLFGKELPFGIQPAAFVISSAVVAFLTVLVGYLLFLTSR